MVTIDWPTSDWPGIHPFRLTVPDGWTATEPVGALVALLGPEADGSRSNLVVFGERLPGSVDPGEVADGMLAHCDQGSLVGPVLDRPERELQVAVRRGTTQVDGTELVQLVAVTAAGDASPAGLRTVFALLGTYPAVRVEPDEAILIDAISSFSTRRPEQRAATPIPSGG